MRAHPRSTPAVLGSRLATFDLHLARLGDPGALSRLMARSHRSLLRGISAMAQRLGLRDIDPEDVFQDTVIRCFRTLPAMRADTERGFRSWFLGAARYQLLTRLRGGETAGGPFSLEIGPEPCADLPPGFDRRPPRLAARGPGQLWSQRTDGRSAVILRELLALSWSDVATVLSRPSGPAARGVHTRARRWLDEDPRRRPGPR